MEQTPNIVINLDGIVLSASDTSCVIMGITKDRLIDSPLKAHLHSKDHKRYDQELEAVREGLQSSGKLKVSSIGVDSVSRPLIFGISKTPSNNINIEVSADKSNMMTGSATTSSIAASARLLPVCRRLAAVCRRSTNKKTLLSDSMAVISEVTNAGCAAAIEWGGAVSDWPVAATTGTFDKEFLKGVFRSSVIGRLARGDVIVKDVLQDGTGSNHSLVLIPLMASQTPEGIIILYVQGYSVLAPRELQSLGLLGEIIGLGIRSLAATNEIEEDSQTRAADIEATIALGRLSAGLAHEINNAVTVLRNNTEQISANAKRFTQNDATDLMTKDSIRAVEVIRDLTDALRAFAPEESRDSETVDLLRVIDMVVASVRFYAKRGLSVNVNQIKETELPVKCRSHYLIRSLFLIFVELVESALASGRMLMINITLVPNKKTVDFKIAVSAGPFNVPTVLLSQLEKDGVLARLVHRAGAALAYEVKEEKLALTLTLPITEAHSKSLLPSPISHKISGRRGTILIVDDEPAIIRSTRRILEKEHDVLAAGTAEEALEIVKANHNIDLLLLDVFMPGMTGLEMAENLKRMSSPLAQRIIFITGGASDMEVSKYLHDSRSPVIEKPLDIPQLLTLISDMLGTY